MITADARDREARLREILGILEREAAPEDRQLLLSFAPVAYAEMPDPMALGLSVPVLAGRLHDYFRFFAREIPPPTQLYRGLPGIHVTVRNPDEGVEERTMHGRVMPYESTVISTHTLDAPFVFESLKNYFRKSGLRVFSAVHPILTVRRQWERIVWIGGPQEEGAKELFCRFRIERIESKERLRRIEHEVYSVLRSVFAAVEDFDEMVKGVREVGARLRSRSGDEAEAASARAFVEWLLDNNYILMGAVRYRVAADGRPDRIAESATGVFTDPSLLPVVFPGVVEEVETHILPAAGDDRMIDIDYCHNASAIYHVEPIDDIVIREWAKDGGLAQATLLLGRFAMGAFSEKAGDIPLLKEKLGWLLRQSDSAPNAYAYRQIRALFNRFPKRELFYADLPSLKSLIDEIVYMVGDDEIVARTRQGHQYVALGVAFARARYAARTESDLAHALAEAFGPISFSTSEDCGSVTLLLFYFESNRLEHPVDADKARRITEQLVTTWEDRVSAALVDGFGEREGRRLFQRHVSTETRSGIYRESTPPEEVPGDLRRLESLEGRLEVSLIPRTAETVTLKLFSNRVLGLTEALRTLENLGLKVTDDLRLPLLLPEGRRGFLFRLEIEAPPARIAALAAGEERLVAALRALDEERATDDALNGLVLDAGLGWRDVDLLRTLRNHLLQIRTHYNVETVNGVLLRNSPAVAALFRLFACRFDPALEGDREAAVAEAEEAARAALEAVRSLAEDEVLRGFLSLVRSALRTNFYQRPERPVVSVKVDSRKVEGMPSPRPMFEIYVHSRLIEGIHLRGGKVARGGIRWSDRHDDFRTEVLGLMKTQMAKNSIIVPVGSKGGFVLKGSVPSRPALDAYLIDRYREFVSGLLDVTDNVVDGEVLHPPEVVRQDGEDPYLVVAADKGTAHLSDTANSVSSQYGFWLGDAFASGGSVGYDHKKVGITARGAWECVKHHFKNLGKDVQREAFTMAGIGDMSGDVFGNGALQSRATRLVAAFNHVHIFVDPEPDPERSYAERERLFRLPRSSWRDYDASLIGKGGGVFDRSAKAIPLSAEMKRLLDIQGDSASGEEVVRRILTARVDLLYNGGIGTYVKAGSEEDEDVGDRANDRVRVDATDVRAKVVGEGGNLGFTQRARLEYWAHGGLVNTDAVDNSGGVDMSDHEVNIKILMDHMVRKGVVPGREERNRILMEMTEQVAELVLADNRNQARALTLDGMRSAGRYDEFVGFVEDMIGAGVLNRQDDAIPTREELLASPERERGLPRPLLAVLLGYTKIWGLDLILETEVPDSPTARRFLDAYFPARLRESFSAHFEEHPLRREIVATAVINHIINCAGILFLSRLASETRAGIGDVVKAYLEVDGEADAARLREEALSPARPAEAEHRALIEIEAALEAATKRVLGGEKASQAVKELEAVRSGRG